MIKEEAIKILSDMRAEHNIFSDDEEEATKYHALSWAIQALNERTGRWIWSEEEWGYRCSACRVKFDYDKTYELFDHGFMLANYCPNCGARMEETDERT